MPHWHLTGGLNPQWDCHTLSSCMELWERRAELINTWEGRCHTVGLFCKFTSLVEALELSQHMILFE